MTSGKKAAIGGTLVLLLAVAVRVGMIYHERNAPAAAPAADNRTADADDLVFLKKQRPSSLADVKQLIGTTVWISAGGQLDYYPCAAHRSDYAKSVGTLLGAEPLAIKDAFEQIAPKSGTFRIPGGDKQVLLAFTMPKSADPAKLYAVPVGYKQGATTPSRTTTSSSSTTIRMSCTSTGDPRCGRRWIRTRSFWA